MKVNLRFLEIHWDAFECWMDKKFAWPDKNRSIGRADWSPHRRSHARTPAVSWKYPWPEPAKQSSGADTWFACVLEQQLSPSHSWAAQTPPRWWWSDSRCSVQSSAVSRWCWAEVVSCCCPVARWVFVKLLQLTNRFREKKIWCKSFAFVRSLFHSFMREERSNLLINVNEK